VLDKFTCDRRGGKVAEKGYNFYNVCVIYSLSSLVSLELRENNIKSLPQSISFLVKLEILDLGSNEIQELVS